MKPDASLVLATLLPKMRSSSLRDAMLRVHTRINTQALKSSSVKDSARPTFYQIARPADYATARDPSSRTGVP